jgi:hypothetical protein
MLIVKGIWIPSHNPRLECFKLITLVDKPSKRFLLSFLSREKVGLRKIYVSTLDRVINEIRFSTLMAILRSKKSSLDMCVSLPLPSPRYEKLHFLLNKSQDFLKHKYLPKKM